MTQEKTPESPINNWLELNEKLHLFKIIAVSLGAVTSLMFMTVLYQGCRPPLVVALEKGTPTFQVATRKEIPIDDRVIDTFLREFLHLLFDWKNFDPKDVIKAIEPMSTGGLTSRIETDLTSKRQKDFKDKVISQGITNVEIKITDTDIIATFDKVLRINGIPLIIPTEVAFNLVKGSQTKWNPVGLYVNGIVEHEGSRD